MGDPGTPLPAPVAKDATPALRRLVSLAVDIGGWKKVVRSTRDFWREKRATLFSPPPRSTHVPPIMADITPRVNKALISKYRGGNVRLVGKVLSQADGKATIEAKDGPVVVSTQSQYGSTYVEVIGHVESDDSIKEFTYSDFGDNFGTPSLLSRRAMPPPSSATGTRTRFF